MIVADKEEIARLQAAAATGDPEACYHWGVRLLYGRRLNQHKADPKEAAPFVILAANADHVGAQALLARMFDDGDGVDKDTALAAKWYRIAAENGDPISMTRVARNASDKAEAHQWMLKAAEAGEHLAFRWLADYYLKGPRGARDEAEGLRWLERAAAEGRGDEDCSVDWANHLEKQRNRVGAYVVLYRAARRATHAPEDVRKTVLAALEQLSAKMTPEERKEGRDRAVEPAS